MSLLRTPSFFVKTIARDIRTLPQHEKFELVKLFWPRADLTIESFHEESYASFLEYVGDELSELRHHQTRFATNNFESIVELIQMLQNCRGKHLSELLSELAPRFLNVDEHSVQRSIELTVRLWLNLNVNSAMIAVGPILAHSGTIDWSPNESLDDLIASQFAGKEAKELSRPKTEHLRSMGLDFTAANLVNLCEIKLNWSDNLADHLVYNRKSRTLTIFKHKICLINHLKTTGDCPIPTAVLEEALDTTNLLFPFGDEATKRLLSQEGQLAFYGLGNCGRDRQDDLREFRFWREELADLFEVYNEPPRTFRQLVIDQRNLVDWAAFWITVMVLLLTMVSIPCSIIQTVYTIKSYNVALAQAQAIPSPRNK
jgi:hypothetical protein